MASMTKSGAFAQALLVSAIFFCTTLTLSAQTFNPSTTGFGNVVVQTTSPAKSVVLTNALTGPLTITSISTSGDFAETSTCPIAPNTLAASAKCQILITFTPTALGGRAGTLTVSDNGTNSAQTAPLSGGGIAAVTLTPVSLGFGNQFLNTVSVTKTMSLTNNQTVPLTIAGVSTSGDYAQTSNCPLSPNTLAAHSSCTVSITFGPTAAGNRADTLTVNDNGPNNPQTAVLTGIGILPVSLSTNSLAFSSQIADTTGAPKTLTLTNNQTSALTIFGISTSGDYAQTSTCPLSPSTLPAGANCSISITFTPTGLGARTGTLTVSDNTNTSPQSASLTGTGSLAGISTISISPSNPSVFTGHQQQLKATGTFRSGQIIDISNVVSWLSSASASVPVSSTGLAQALAEGTATITASYGSISSSTTVTAVVTALSSITVTPANPSQQVGASQQFTAVLNYNDGSTKTSTTAVSWSSSSNAVATVNSVGLTSALSPGSTTIQASVGSISGGTALTVAQPSCSAAPAGLVGWWTGDGNTIDIAGGNSGALQSSATYGSGEVAQGFSFGGNGASLQISSTVYSPSAGTLMLWFLPNGAAGALTGSYVAPQNRAPGFLIDSSGNLNWEFGNLYSQSLGQVSANQWNHVALTYSTSNAQITVNVYLNGALVADALADANTSWNPQVAFGAYLGAQQPSFTGSIDEIAIFNQALTSSQIQQIYNAFSAGMCKPQLQSITVSPDPGASLAPGLSLQFDALGSYSDGSVHDLTTSAIWSTANPTIAAINASGLGTGVASGSTTVTAAMGSLTGSTNVTVAQNLVSIQVTPQNPSRAAGAVQPFIAVGTFANGSQQDLTNSVTWTGSTPSVATIASNGQATCLATGQSTMTATAGSVSASSLLTVTSATLVSVAVNPATANVVAGATQQFTATGTFNDGSQQNVTASVSWSSSIPAVATIFAGGVATAVGSGQSTITANLGSVSGTANLTGSTATLAAIQITPQSPTVAIGGSQQFSANGTYSDGTSSNISASVTWNSSAPTVATMNGSLPGAAISAGTGQTRISASFGGLTSSTTLAVQDQLVSLVVTPPSITIAAGNGNSQAFIANGTYASGITQNLTNSVSWSSSVPSVAAVSLSGLATGLTSGQTNIEATVGNIFGYSEVLVASPDPLGTAIATNIVCPATGATGGTCYALAISCPNISDITGYVKVRYSGGTPLGTVLFSMGGTGVGLYESYNFGPTVLNAVLQAGYTVADISWGGPFTTLQPEGWETGPGGVRALTCRYATLAQWIYTNIHLANTAAPFCATGSSAGAESVGIALSHYGMGSIFAMVEPTSGPVFTREDWACDCRQSNATNPCGLRGTYCVGITDAQTFIDPAFAAPVCSQEVTSHSTANDAVFYQDSVIAPDSVVTYPNTFVKFLYGALDPDAPLQGHVWASSITSSKAESCVPNVGHSLPSALAGAQQISNDIVTYCKLQSGTPR